MNPDQPPARHLRTFYLLTVTQVLSIIGSIMTHTAVGIRVFSDTGTSTPLLMASFFAALPLMVGGLYRASWLVVYGVARTPALLGLALFFVFFTNALVDASFMSILQLKVPPDMQGRIFSLLFQLMYIATPLALLLTGPLVDRVLEPAVGGPGWAIVAPLVGSRPGSGMGLLISAAGALIFLLTAFVYAWPKTRSIEADLPDYAAVADG
jgi:hypothetical protein